MAIVETSQAPDAKPVAVSLELTTDWQDVVTAPTYIIPEESFGGGVIEVPGVAEIIAPLLVCNKTSTTETISVRVYRENQSDFFMIVNEVPVVANNMITIPLNGQFIYADDILQVKAGAISSIDITMSYTVGQAEQDTLPGEE